MHEKLVRAFRAFGDDPENLVVILTKILREGTHVLQAILDIEVPMIAAVNGRIFLHSDTTVFADLPHPAFGIVPGDGLHVLWPEVIGEIRGR